MKGRILAVVVGLLCASTVQALSIPSNAKKYQRTLIREAHAAAGLDAPVAMFAAQVHQESGWNERAKSYVGAQGLAQFMPATADWISDLYPAGLGSNEPYDPHWALRALVKYDVFLKGKVKGKTACDQWAKALSAYNGGLGWIARDEKLAVAAGEDPMIWFGGVEKFNSGRKPAYFKENRGYPHRILRVVQPAYELWGESVKCS